MVVSRAWARLVRGERRERVARLVVLPAVVVSALLAGCGGTATPAGGAASTDSARTTSSTTPAGTAPSTTSAAPADTGSQSPTATASPSSTRAPATSVAARWPKTVGEPQQGDPVWAVYLAVGHSATDAAVEQAVRAAAGVGYQAVVSDIACDDGAMQALGLDEYDYWSGATLYFATRADATTFAASYTAQVAKPKGLAKVNLGCLD